MSYRCNVCTAKVPPGQSLRRHVVKRPNGQISAEIPVCEGCRQSLAQGKNLNALKHHYRLNPPVETKTVISTKRGRAMPVQVPKVRPAPPAEPSEPRIVEPPVDPATLLTFRNGRPKGKLSLPPVANEQPKSARKRKSK